MIRSWRTGSAVFCNRIVEVEVEVVEVLLHDIIGLIRKGTIYMYLFMYFVVLGTYSLSVPIWT